LKNLRFFSEIKSDLPAGLVVFLVALPLCLGIALASGAPMFAGLIAGIVGGTIVAFMSDSQLGVSGPAAGLVVIVLAGIAELGSFEAFLLAVAIGGLLQFLMGLAKAGFVAYYFPSSVIKGMLVAIGIIIFLKQIPHAVGYDGDPMGDLAFLQLDGETTFSELGHMMGFLNPGAIVISVISLAILILWQQNFIKKQQFSNVVPGALVAVGVGLGLNVIFTQFIPSFALSAEHLVTIPVLQEGETVLNLLTFPDFSQLGNPAIYKIALILAIVASLETLLTAEATDKLDPYRRITPPNKELRAQGIGNLVSGLIGGLPITQVIVRSSANIQSGGKTKAASVFHGILLTVSVLAFPAILNMIPLASLAAILIMVGFKLARPTVFKEVFKLGWQQSVPFLTTIVAILVTDLLVGIGIGMAVAVFLILRNHFLNAFSFHRIESTDHHRQRLVLAEEVSFLNKASILKQLNELPDETIVEIDARQTVHMDYDVWELINEFKQTAKRKRIELSLIGFPGQEEVQTILSKSQKQEPDLAVEG
jgi:MFS superfamily sulfate permease-like transporter